MRLEWIEDILAVQDTGSFNAAAEVRFLTPSAFTRRIRTIENALGAELFDRTKKPVILHKHAFEKIGEMRNAVHILKQLHVELSDSDESSKRQVSLICQQILTSSLLPKIIKQAFKDDGFKIRVRSGSRNDCLLGLIKRDVQFSLTYEEEHEKNFFDKQSAEQLFLGYETYIPVAKIKSNPLLQQKIEDRSIPIINYPSSVYLGDVQNRNVFTNLDPDIRLHKVAESGLVFAVAELVKHGLGVGWLPESLVDSELERNELVNLEDILPKWRLNIKLSRFIGSQTQLADDFWDLIQRNFEKREDDELSKEL